jgi:preprotein translocase subunit SecB
MAENEATVAQTGGEQKTIQPQKIYLKDVSLETPNSPNIFTKKWDPEIKVEFQNSAKEIDTDIYEVVVTLTVTTSIAGETAYLAEVQQAGVFVMKGFELADLHMKQNVFCVRILYPYASAAISDLVTRGGFPQLVLTPLNFRQMYANSTNQPRETIDENSEET